MPEFTNPFTGVVPDRKMTKSELIRAIRLDIAAEHEAVHIYLAQADVADDPLARKVLRDVADEEREHIGEFMRLLSILAPEEDGFIASGAEEVNEMAREIGQATEAGPEEEGPDIPTVGDIKE